MNQEKSSRDELIGEFAFEKSRFEAGEVEVEVERRSTLKPYLHGELAELRRDYNFRPRPNRDRA